MCSNLFALFFYKFCGNVGRFFDLASCILQTSVSYVCKSIESHKCIMQIIASYHCSSNRCGS